jgi:Na+-translocating ferredoxin:NAD+ oxidoreductase RnfD subunit
VILAVALLPGAWVSPGQWGNDIALSVWCVALGSLVVRRAGRMDTSWAFLGAYLGLLALRVWWLGQSGSVWWHQLESGALLVFAFFMISDPMTSPNHRHGRWVHVVAVASVAYLWQFVLYRPNGLLWALFLCAPLVPILDALFSAPVFRWRPHASVAVRA